MATSEPLKIDLPPMYARQWDALCAKARFVVVEGSTKSGKTAGCITWQAAQALKAKEHTVHWWVAPSYGQARIAFRRVARDYEDVIKHVDKGLLEITLTSGARWAFKSGENFDALYGEEVHSAVLDEASRMRVQSWEAVRSTLSTTKGPARMIGNVRGRRNWFYELCRRAQSGLQGYHYAMLTAQDAVDGGVLDASEIEQARVDLPQAIFDELYFCKPSEDAYNPFGLAQLDAAFGDVIHGDPAVVYGLDLARKRDWTVLTGMSARGHVVSVDRFQLPWGEAYERIKSVVGTRPVLLDATGIGDPIADALTRHGVNVTPFVKTSSTKQDLMSLLRSGFAEGRIRHDNEILKVELESFEYFYGLNGGVRYSAPDGMHDDCVDSLALAYWHATHLGALRVSTHVATRVETTYAPVGRPRARMR